MAACIGKIVSQQYMGRPPRGDGPGETNPGLATELLKAMGQGDEKAADALPALDFQRIGVAFS
jgi:hypothetical protein